MVKSDQKIIAIVGMTGSGKTECAKVFRGMGYPVIRFGDVTETELRKRGLEINEKNEKMMRENLRKELGMHAYAKLNLDRIEKSLKKSNVVVLDGLYSWEELTFLKDRFEDSVLVLATIATPKIRYERLKRRRVRPLSLEDSINRDLADINNLNKGGPIAMADRFILNEGSIEDFREKVKSFCDEIGR